MSNEPAVAPPAKLRTLNTKQREFCHQFVVDLNATQSAIRAGYSKRTAHVIGHELLSKPNVQALVAELRAELAKRTEVSAELIVNELRRVAMARIDNIMEVKGRGKGRRVIVKDIESLSPDALAAVSSIKNLKDGSIEIRLHDKLSALEQLGRHLGIFEKDNTQRQMALNLAVIDYSNAPAPGFDDDGRPI